MRSKEGEDRPARSRSPSFFSRARSTSIARQSSITSLSRSISTIKLVVYTPLIAGFSMLVYQAAAAPFAGLSALDLPLKGVLVGTIAIPILAIVVADFGFFLSHYLMHKIPILWYFHEVHHSAEVLTPVTVYRTHPVEDLINATIASLIAGIGAAAYTSTTGNEVLLPTMFGINASSVRLFLARVSAPPFAHMALVRTGLELDIHQPSTAPDSPQYGSEALGQELRLHPFALGRGIWCTVRSESAGDSAPWRCERRPTRLLQCTETLLPSVC